LETGINICINICLLNISNQQNLYYNKEDRYSRVPRLCIIICNNEEMKKAKTKKEATKTFWNNETEKIIGHK